MASVSAPFVTPEQYLELDSKAERPSEYYDGEMFEVQATSLQHNQVQVNLIAVMVNRLQGKSCQVLGPTMRVQIPNRKKYCYPDLVVACGALELEAYDTLVNPTVIFEVLSDNNADFDRGGKARMYHSIPSLKEYIVISQHEPSVERWTRTGMHKWSFEEFTGFDTLLPLEAIGCEVLLRELYARVEFEPELKPQ